MKKLVYLMAYAAIIALFSACSEDYSDVERAPKYITQTDTVVIRDTIPTPPPTPSDSVPENPETTDWHWSVIGDQTLFFNVETEVVEANNIGLLTRQVNGVSETKLDSAQLKYQLLINIEAPTYIRITKEKSDTTVLGTAQSDPSPSYGEYVVTKKDSTRSVTTGHTFTASHYNITATTVSKRGFSRHPKHDEAFKYVTEKAQWASIWNEYIGEVEDNDSIFARYNVHNNLTFVIISNKGEKWYVKREKVVIVDHFVRVKEKNEEPKDDGVKADFWANGLKKFISCTKVWRDDTKSWSDAYLFEAENSYEIILANYRVKGDKEEFFGTQQVSVPFSTCPKLNDYDAVAQIGGNFYPACITIKSDGWGIGAKINGKAYTQEHSNQAAVSTGIKNLSKDNAAKPTPRITSTQVVKEVNGKKIITVTAKTTVHTGVFTMADVALKN